ncbi:TlpA family protein disulfide reductase [Pirellulaceae bacterium SH449]
MAIKHFTLGMAIAASGATSFVFADELTQAFIGEGVTQRVGGYSPVRAEMDLTEEIVKKLPEGLANPKFGMLKIGGSEWAFVLDEPEEGDARFFVDSDRDGDLTNDPDTTWQAQKVGEFQQFSGSCKIELPSGDVGTVNMYRFDPKDPRRKPLANTLMYYADFGYEYKFKLDGKDFSTFLAGAPSDNAPLSIDRDGNGVISRRYEIAAVGKPFNFTGTTYEFSVADKKLALKVSEKQVDQLPPPPDLSMGKKVIEFTATSMDDAEIKFPSTYAGKIVMLDFWATWCGPCIAEIPNMKQAYDDWHDKGFEILGISLDNAGMDEKVREFLKERELPWAQVYQGKGWDIDLATTYDVSGIPFVLLVDGNTGEIIGTSRQLRGPKLSEYIGKQLEKRGLVTKTEE